MSDFWNLPHSKHKEGFRNRCAITETLNQLIKLLHKKVLDCYMLPRKLSYWGKWSNTILNSNEINIVSVIHYKKINFPSIIRPKGHINKYYVINIHPFVTEERILKVNPWFFYYFLRHFVGINFVCIFCFLVKIRQTRDKTKCLFNEFSFHFWDKIQAQSYLIPAFSAGFSVSNSL